MEHKFKEYRFYSENCQQDWKCTECGVISTLPLGVKPTDYHNGYCKGASDVKVNNSPVCNVQNDIQLRSRDKHKSNKNGVRFV